MANEYPTPFYSGPFIAKYIKVRKDYKEISVFSEFEDGGMDVLEHAADAPQRWSLIYRGLTETQRNVILAHYNTNKLSARFTFKEPRDDPWSGTTGNTYTDLVQYESAPEQPEHIVVQGAAHSLIVHLIKRPV